MPKDKDDERLQEAMKANTDVSSREFISLLFRNSQRRILTRNINLLQVLMRILSRVRTSAPQDIKFAYMSRVEDFETPEEVMPNRLILRRYLRELMLNQRRIHQITKENSKNE